MLNSCMDPSCDSAHDCKMMYRNTPGQLLACCMGAPANTGLLVPYRVASYKLRVILLLPAAQSGNKRMQVPSAQTRRLLSEGLLPLQPASYGLHNALRRHELLLRRARCASAHFACTAA